MTVSDANPPEVRLASGGFSRCDFPGETLVFVPANGKVHLLSSLAGDLLHVLCDEPVTLPGLTTLMNAQLSGNSDGEVVEQDIEQMVDALISLGLVERMMP